MSLNADAEKSMREIFKLVDTKSKGSISAHDFKKLAKSVGMQLSKEQMAELMKDVDTDNSGDIVFDEFIAAMRKDINPDDLSIDEIKELFKSFSTSSTPGLISIPELKRILIDNLNMEIQEVHELIKDLEISVVRKEAIFGTRPYFNYGEYLECMQSQKKS